MKSKYRLSMSAKYFKSFLKMGTNNIQPQFKRISVEKTLISHFALIKNKTIYE